MKWKKCGMICNKKVFPQLEWYKLNCMCPTPFLLDERTIRIFVAFCDSLNQGRIGYIDVLAYDPGVIIDYSKEPVLDIGKKGRFDENGVLPTSLLYENEQLFLYYCGFQKQAGIPYTSLCGIAVSSDNGNTFERVKETPVLERVDDELFIRTGAFIKKEADDKYVLYYASGTNWFELHNGKLEPIYNLKRIFSERIDSFSGAGETVLELIDDEYGITIPQVLSDGSIIFSSRTKSYGYRIGHAKLINNRFIRDCHSIISVSRDGWDSEMVCFGKTIQYKGKEYLFYCGNHYGIGGMGWAERNL